MRVLFGLFQCCIVQTPEFRLHSKIGFGTSSGKLESALGTGPVGRARNERQATSCSNMRQAARVRFMGLENVAEA